MTISRRKFLRGAAGVGAAAGLGVGPGWPRDVSAETSSGGNPPADIPPDRSDPWVEVDPQALRFNVEVLSRLAGGRPILAVIKNNAYGLDLVTVARILEPLPQVWGLAVVKTQAALALKEAGIAKPVVLMALFGDSDGPELVRRGVDLCMTTDDAGERVRRAFEGAGVGLPWAGSAGNGAGPTGNRIGSTTAAAPNLHAYLDTGMSRMGVSFRRAADWMMELQGMGITPRSTFMGFTEEPDYDRVQLRRLLEVARQVRARGGDPGILHAASSAAVFNFPEAKLEMVRPGIALFGAYPSNEGSEAAIAELRPALRVRARVVRVERLEPGDSVSYGRNYMAREPTWVATIPLGHSDGYPREAVEGAGILINGELYPPGGAVSASHTVVELGPSARADEDPPARIGDVATLMGPEHPAIHPNGLATRTGRSVYDVLMHLSARMPRVVVG